MSGPVFLILSGFSGRNGSICVLNRSRRPIPLAPWASRRSVDRPSPNMRFWKLSTNWSTRPGALGGLFGHGRDDGKLVFGPVGQFAHQELYLGFGRLALVRRFGKRVGNERELAHRILRRGDRFARAQFTGLARQPAHRTRDLAGDERCGQAGKPDDGEPTQNEHPERGAQRTVHGRIGSPCHDIPPRQDRALGDRAIVIAGNFAFAPAQGCARPFYQRYEQGLAQDRRILRRCNDRIVAVHQGDVPPLWQAPGSTANCSRLRAFWVRMIT